MKHTTTIALLMLATTAHAQEARLEMSMPAIDMEDCMYAQDALMAMFRDRAPDGEFTIDCIPTETEGEASPALSEDREGESVPHPAEPSRSTPLTPEPLLPFERNASLTGQSRSLGYDYETSIWRYPYV